MISVAEARARILAALSTVGSEWVPLTAALDRVLAADLHARRSQPMTAVSAMDGYAVRAADTEAVGAWLTVVGESRAGGEPVPALNPGEAARIFTGAPLPTGADAVAIQENAERDGNRVRFTRASGLGEFVRPAGLDFVEGWCGLVAGTRLDPRRLGLAAIMGHGWLSVRRRPRVAILATGDELCPPGETPGPHRVVSSNSLVLAGLVRSWGGEPVDLGIARDSPEDLTRALADVQRVDLLVTSGGASVGDYDLVRSTLGREGLVLDFWKIAMRPGKPLVFGYLRDVPFLGLPGNPVSSVVCAIVFLRAALRRLQGLDPALPLVAARLGRDLPANDEREDHLRATLMESGADGPIVIPAGRQDSSMLATMALADALIVRAPHVPAAVAGETVTIVRLVDALRA